MAGNRILARNLSFIADDGRLTCITGGEGSGKTTLIRMLMGLEPTKEGFVSIDGELLSVRSAPTFRRMIAYLPQGVHLLSHLLKPAEAPECVADEYAVWNSARSECPRLSDVAELEPEDVYRLLEQVVTQPGKTMVVADEPAVHLSTELTERLLLLLRQQADQGKAVLIASRRPEITSRCDQLISLNPESV